MRFRYVLGLDIQEWSLLPFMLFVNLSWIKRWKPLLFPVHVSKSGIVLLLKLIDSFLYFEKHGKVFFTVITSKLLVSHKDILIKHHIIANHSEACSSTFWPSILKGMQLCYAKIFSLSSHLIISLLNVITARSYNLRGVFKNVPELGKTNLISERCRAQWSAFKRLWTISTRRS